MTMKMNRHWLKQETLQEMLQRKLQTDEDGNIVYPGNENTEKRTGSNLRMLLTYAFGDTKNGKPLDYEILRDMLINVMKIPSDQLYQARVVWKQIK